MEHGTVHLVCSLSSWLFFKLCFQYIHPVANVKQLEDLHALLSHSLPIHARHSNDLVLHHHFSQSTPTGASNAALHVQAKGNMPSQVNMVEK